MKRLHPVAILVSSLARISLTALGQRLPGGVGRLAGPGAMLPSLCAAEPPPNIVIFLVDDMGVMDTSVPFLTDAAGQPQRYPLNDYYRTPNMERLAARGIRFNNFCAMSVCSPTRISIMTGQNAARHRTTNWINPDKDNAGPNGPPQWNWKGLKKGDVTLAGLLHAGGYRTIHVGKGHFGPRESEGAEPRNLGFDVNVGGASIGAPGQLLRQGQFRPRLEACRQRRPAPGEVPRHRDVSHRGADDRGQGPRHRRRPGGPAVLPVSGPLRGPRAVPQRSAFCRALPGLRQAGARPGVCHLDRGHGQVARRSPRSSRRARRRRKHARLLPRRQRLRRAAGPSARGRLRRSAARQEGRALRRRHAGALHRRVGETQRRPSPSAATANSRGSHPAATRFGLRPVSHDSGFRRHRSAARPCRRRHAARHAAGRQARSEPDARRS